MSRAEFSARLAVTALVAVVVPLVVGLAWGDKLGQADQVFLGLFILILGTLSQVAIEVRYLRDERDAGIVAWRIEKDSDAVLANIRASFSGLQEDGNALYVQYFLRELRRLDSRLLEASTKKELIVDQDSDTTDMMLQPFHGRDSDVIRIVHFFRNNDFLFDVHARQFFYEVARLVSGGQIREIKRLFVYSARDDLSNERTQRLIQFHDHVAGFAYEAMRGEDYEKVKRDYRLPVNVDEFGIYADYYVYTSIAANADEINGVFSALPATVSKFTNFFDRCWNSPVSHGLDVVPASLSVAELFQDLPGRANVPPTEADDDLGAATTLGP